MGRTTEAVRDRVGQAADLRHRVEAVARGGLAGVREARRLDRDPKAAVRRLHALVGEVVGLQLPVRLWDGEEWGPTDADWRLVLREPWSLRALLRPPLDLSAGEAYLADLIDFEGDILAMVADGERIGRALTADPSGLARLAPVALSLPRPPRRTEPERRRARLRGRMHSKGRDRGAVAHHYDLPASFYETFLDRDLVYSCGYFAEPAGDLEEAQRRKLDLVCRKLRLEPGQRLLDIGCGFGSLLIHAAREYGVEGLGVTLSRTQVDRARARIDQAGLSDRVRVELADYRDVADTFDAVASVGMVEHVGPDGLAPFFAACRERVRPGGLVLCHSIVLQDPDAVRRGDERTFVTAYVFPDGGLVPAWRLTRECQQAGLDLLDVQQLRPHYAWTCIEWIARLEAAHDRVVALVGEAAYRTWRVYLAGSAHSFAADSLGVVQVLSRVPAGASFPPHRRAPVANADLPIGRDWMEPREPDPAGAR